MKGKDPMEEETKQFTYQDGRTTYYQEELTYGQDKQLIKIYKFLKKRASKDEELQVRELQNLLVKHNLLDRFFGIVLKPVWDTWYVISFKWLSLFLTRRIAPKKLGNSQIRKFFEDFFLLNQTLVMLLSEYATALGWIADKAIPGPGGRKESKTSSAKRKAPKLSKAG